MLVDETSSRRDKEPTPAGSPHPHPNVWQSNIQHYTSLAEFCERHSLSLPKGKQHLPWRLTSKAPVGVINGLSHLFRGKAIATNGILVALENEVGFVTIGHMDWFLPDENDPEIQKDLPSAQIPNKPRVSKKYNLAVIDALLE